MNDHLTIHVSDDKHGKAFYIGALKPLGYVVVVELSLDQIPSLPCELPCGLGVGGKPDLWLRQDARDLRPHHFAIASPSRAAVGELHSAALAAGAQDNGAPGPHYHPDY